MAPIRSATTLPRASHLVTLFSRAVALALALACILPLHASDERAIKQRVAPIYPELAKRMKVSGTVKVAATVAPNGTVSSTKVVSGNHMLSGAAEDAVHKWKFVAADGESTVEVDVNFALAQ